MFRFNVYVHALKYSIVWKGREYWQNLSYFDALIGGGFSSSKRLMQK